jgi:hypothetical protein
MNMNRLTVSIPLAFAVCLLLAACASTPEASLERDAEAKQFLTHPNAATIYVYRSPHNRIDSDSVLYVDGRLLGSTLPGTYFRIDTVPGRHVLHGIALDAGQLELEVRPGQTYFVALDVIGGHSRFTYVPEQVGRERVRACCALLENWGPGQRPFLR